MSTYIPDKWVVIQFTHPTTGEKIDKVLAGWYGGFAGADEWKLNSGIVKVDEYKNRFEFHGSSGSTYVCYKNCHGFSMLTRSMFEYWSKSVEVKTLEEYDVQPERT